MKKLALSVLLSLIALPGMSQQTKQLYLVYPPGQTRTTQSVYTDVPPENAYPWTQHGDDSDPQDYILSNGVVIWQPLPAVPAN